MGMALVLVVDDDEDFRSLVGAALAYAGHTVVEAENGRDGFKVFVSKRPQIVVTDIQMPIRDGLDLISDIRQTDVVVPIVAMTGGIPDLLRTAQALGANRGISKGGSMDYVIGQVEELLKSA
jgi:CheY-like chemotaxis protein